MNNEQSICTRFESCPNSTQECDKYSTVQVCFSLGLFHIDVLFTQGWRTVLVQNYQRHKNSSIRCRERLLGMFFFLRSKYLLTRCLLEVRQEMSPEAYEEVSSLGSQIPAKLLSLHKNKVGKGKAEKKFEESIRIFCISLHMKSASAYRHLRSCFEDALPCERTIRKWCQKVDCSPGFSRGALKYLSDKALEYQVKNQHLLCSLTFDEMAIREQVQFDGK